VLGGTRNHCGGSRRLKHVQPPVATAENGTDFPARNGYPASITRLARNLVWVELRMSIEPTYFNNHRTHTSREGRTPDTPVSRPIWSGESSSACSFSFSFGPHGPSSHKANFTKQKCRRNSGQQMGAISALNPARIAVGSRLAVSVLLKGSRK
jgi:hypothetical protein